MSLFLSAIRNPQSEIQSSISGSTLWQVVFLSFAAVLLLFELLRGWRLGIMRQLMRGAAIIAAYATAWFGGGLLVPLLRPILSWPDFVISMIGGALLAMIVYGVISSLGSILFKRTAQQSSGSMRFAYGLSGALVGLCFGAFFLWLILVGIRAVGSIAEAQVQARSPAGISKGPSARTINPRLEDPAPLRNLDADSVAVFIARLKSSVELGQVGNLIKKTDVTPDSVYQTLNDIGTVAADPQSAQRFLSFPGAVELAQHPKIVALRNDPEIAEIIAQGRILELLNHPRLREAANDPTLVERVKKFDLKKALEYAAQKE
jgi:hypothetical protein